MRIELRNKGFTLIELIVVIVILGVMAAVAAPKFVGMQRDARISVIQGLKASMYSAASLVHAKAQIQNQDGGSGGTSIARTVVVSFGNVEIDDYYPEANPETFLGILDIIDVSDPDLTTSTPTNRLARIGYDVADNGCYAEYEEVGGGTEPAYREETTGC